MIQDNYELIDFGEGRKLERFGDAVFDRPAPVTENISKSSSKQWADANFRYDCESPSHTGERSGKWTNCSAVPDCWSLGLGDFTLQLQQTPFGHLGIFPEQIENWIWIQKQIQRIPNQGESMRPKVLNLFAYTGGSTLAAASAGAEVVHIDSAKNIVSWAKRNAACSELGDAPIRWIVEDAALFVKREVNRGNKYEGIILDPPSYGHGPAGQMWKIQKHLMPLLRNCAELIENTGRFFLLSCHTPEFGPAEIQAMVADALVGDCRCGAIAQPASIRTKTGRQMPAGTVLRWQI